MCVIESTGLFNNSVKSENFVPYWRSVVSIKNLFVYSWADSVAADTRLSINVSSSDISTFKNAFASAVVINTVAAAVSTVYALISLI